MKIEDLALRFIQSHPHISFKHAFWVYKMLHLTRMDDFESLHPLLSNMTDSTSTSATGNINGTTSTTTTSSFKKLIRLLHPDKNPHP